MSRRKSAQHREMWTEDEVMEFGLAGEEEYCDMQVMEEIELSPPSFNSSMAPVDITKSGRVRKKTAKLIEMEEIDKLEKKQTVPARKPEVAKLSVGKKGKTVALKLSPDTIKLGSVTSIKEPDSELSSSDDLQPLVINTSFHKRSSSQSTKLAVKRKFDSSPDDVMSLPTKASRPTKKLKKKAQEVKVKVYESDLAVDYDGNSWSDGDMKGQFSLSVDESGLDQGDDFVENEGHKDLTPKIPVTKPKKPGRKKSMPLVSAVKQEQMSTPPSIQLASISAPAVPASYQYQGDNLLSEDKFENSYLNPLKKEKIRKKLKVEVKDSSFGESSNLSNYASCKKSLQIQLKKSLQATKKLLGQPKKKRQKGYTAYMLWCGVQRARVVAQNPGIDFAQISKRLGDMWQTVPEKEKMTWRRKARKMAKKGSSFINTGRPRIAPIETILIPEQQQQQQPMSKMVYHGKLPKNKEKSLVEDHSPVHSKVTGSDPMDVAAHLKLLGESLTVIGARLQEHKGQIAVQGSMSVLLDSLVCTLGSLLCLTSQVPELNGCPDEIHRRTLDNIAYIMPGVG